MNAPKHSTTSAYCTPGPSPQRTPHSSRLPTQNRIGATCDSRPLLPRLIVLRQVRNRKWRFCVLLELPRRVAECLVQIVKGRLGPLAEILPGFAAGVADRGELGMGGITFVSNSVIFCSQSTLALSFKVRPFSRSLAISASNSLSWVSSFFWNSSLVCRVYSAAVSAVWPASRRT